MSINKRFKAVLAGLLVFGQTAPVLSQTPVTVAGKIPGQFSVTESGAASYRIPLEVPPGVAGMEPKLALVYNSQAGNGLLGVGWGLEGLSAITRCPKTLAQDDARGSVNYDANDRYCLDGQRLMLVSGTYGAAGSEYRTERESFTKLVAYGSAGNGPAYFVAQTKSGQTLEYGSTTDSRIEAVKVSGSVASWPTGTVRAWAVNKVTDVVGNYMTTTYVEDATNGDYYASRIDYAGNNAATTVPANSVRFVVDDRPDVLKFFLAGSAARSIKRLTKIEMYKNNDLVHEYKWSYTRPNAYSGSQITSVQRCIPQGHCLNPVESTWQQTGSGGFTRVFHQTAYSATTAPFWRTGADAYQTFPMDVNGDGKTDVVQIGTNEYRAHVLISNGDGTFNKVFEQTSSSGPFWRTGADVVQSFPLDVNGDGKMDMVQIMTNEYRARVLMSNGDGTFTKVFEQTAYSATSAPFWRTGADVFQTFPMDVNGDGKTDIVQIGTNDYIAHVLISNGNGTFTLAFDQTLASYQAAGGPFWRTGADAFQSFPADVNGDGKMDMVQIMTNEYKARVLISNGDGTFTKAAEQLTYPGASSSFWRTGADAAQTFPMDVNGDGKTDFVQIGTNEYNAQVLLSNGDGSFGLAYSQTLSTYYQNNNGPFWRTGADVVKSFPLDVNGDGKMDMVQIMTNDYWARVLISNGDGSFTKTLEQTAYSPTSTPFWRSGNDAAQTFPMDINGDGKSDVLQIMVNDYYAQSLFALGAAGQVISGIGSGSATVNVNLGSATQASLHSKDGGAIYPLMDLQIPIHVVSQVDESNGVGGVVSTQYTYGGLKAEVGTGRGLLGFRWTKAKNLSTNVESYTEYRQDWPYTGLVAKTETRLAGAGSAGLLKRVTNTYACQHPGTGSACAVAVGGRYFPYASQSVEEGWDLNGAVLPVTTSAFTYGQSPQWGDPTQIVVSTGAGASKTTVNEWWPADTSAGRWISGRLKKATVTSVSP